LIRSMWKMWAVQTRLSHHKELHHAGPYGMLPRDIANRLKEYKLKPWNVTQAYDS